MDKAGEAAHLVDVRVGQCLVPLRTIWNGNVKGIKCQLKLCTSYKFHTTVIFLFVKVLIIGPWNYPIMLALMPLAASIAAGNCAAIKVVKTIPPFRFVWQKSHFHFLLVSCANFKSLRSWAHTRLLWLQTWCPSTWIRSATKLSQVWYKNKTWVKCELGMKLLLCTRILWLWQVDLRLLKSCWRRSGILFFTQAQPQLAELFTQPLPKHLRRFALSWVGKGALRHYFKE